MITLITAVPGSGKTLYAITMIEDALTAGRPVYTNINGLVREKFTNPHLLYDAPDDWRDTPEGSLVIYDEAQQSHLYPSNAQRGRVDDERLTAMETHRHSGHDLVFITQAPTFVHHHIRKLVGLHIHLYRARGIKGAMKYEWSHTCDSPNDRGEQTRADSGPWPFPSKFFPYYTSAVIHTHKFRVPKKIMVMLVFILVLVAVAAALSFSAFDSIASDREPEVGEAVQASATAPPPPSTTYAWSSTPEAIPVAGCIANESRSRCQCFSEKGVTLDLSHSACLSVISSPFPRNIVATSNNEKD